MKLIGYHTIAYRDVCIIRTMVDQKMTIRETAKEFGISKSTVYDLIHRYMKKYPSDSLTEKIQNLLRDNWDSKKEALKR